MSIKNKLLSIAALVMASALCLNVQADASLKQIGTIAGVNLENNTFSVNLNNGATEEYSFPTKVKVIVDGIVSHDKSLIQPGQSVMLKFSSASDRSMAYSNENPAEFTIAGTVIQLDRVAGKGKLREDRTHNLVPFRFADNFRRFDMPMVGDKVVFTYVLDGVNVGMK